MPRSILWITFKITIFRMLYVCGLITLVIALSQPTVLLSLLSCCWFLAGWVLSTLVTQDEYRRLYKFLRNEDAE